MTTRRGRRGSRQESPTESSFEKHLTMPEEEGECSARMSANESSGPQGRAAPRDSCQPSQQEAEASEDFVGTLGEPERARIQAASWLLIYAEKKLLSQRDEIALAAQAFLTSAGINWEGVPRLGLGVLGPIEECFEEYRITGGPNQKPLEYWLKDRRVENSLIGPIRNAAGEVVTLWAKPLQPPGTGWLFRHSWQKTVGAFGIETLAKQRPPHVLAVERLGDALALRSHGIEPVIAFGCRFDEVPPHRWSELLRWDVVQITLLPAGPCVPNEVFRSLRRHLRGLARCPELWLLGPSRVTLPLGRFVAQVGRQEFIQLLREKRVPFLGRKQLFVVGSSVKGRTAASTENTEIDRNFARNARISGRDQPSEETARQYSAENAQNREIQPTVPPRDDVSSLARWLEFD